MTVKKLATAIDLYHELNSGDASVWVYQRSTGETLFAVFPTESHDLNTAPEVTCFARISVATFEEK